MDIADTSSDDGPSLVGIDFPKMDDGRYACPWHGCGQILSNIGNTKRHYKQTHMEQQPQACKVCRFLKRHISLDSWSCVTCLSFHKVCHIELRNQAACDQHMKQTHNVTNKEIKITLKVSVWYFLIQSSRMLRNCSITRCPSLVLRYEPRCSG